MENEKNNSEVEEIKKEEIKQESLLKEFVKNPFEQIKLTAKGEKNIIKKSIGIMIIFALMYLIYAITYSIKNGIYKDSYNMIMMIIILILEPIISILISSVVIMIIAKKETKDFSTILSTVVISEIPARFYCIIKIIETLVVRNITVLTNPVAILLNSLSIVFMCVGIKEILEEKDNKKFIKKYALMIICIEYITVFLSNLIRIAL